jgi:isoleucyl-tRNA synthetase
MVHGMITDLEKRKMSKSLGNIITPQEMIDKYGRDYLRYYLISMSKGADFAIDEEAFKDIGKFFMILFNIHKFISLLGFEIKDKAKGREIEDRWILSKLNSTIKEVIEDYNNYTFHKAAEKIMDFVINDLSRKYIQITREREGNKNVLNYCFVSVIKLLAPIAPHLTEYLYKEMNAKNSVHLKDFPKIGRIDKKLEYEFNKVFQIIETGLAERDKLKIGLKWPLAKATISYDKKLNKELEKIVLNQLNIKKIIWKESSEIKVEFDTKLTPELEAEGYARELSRKVQAFRKKLGLEKKDKIDLLILADGKFKEVLEKNKNFIKERTNSVKLEITTDIADAKNKNKIKENFKNKTDFSVKDKRGEIIITRR